MRRKFLLVEMICVFIFFYSVKFAQVSERDSINIYLVKVNWHTGLMIPVNDFTKKILPVLSYFDGFKYVDIGWGDAEFYQSPGFNICLAVNAILVPTPTVIRIDGYKFPIERVIEWREFAIQFVLTKERFLRMADFINQSFKYDDYKKVIISLRDKEKPIIFFKSVHYYFFMRTCNTWAAEAIQSTGVEIDTFGLVTAGQLYSKLSRFGKILKKYE
ncbi:MAG: DUF2459 domain-containing protein [Melioribacteraceae bacterium]